MRLLRIQGSDTKRYIEFNYNDLNKERIVRSDEDWFVQGMQG